MATWSLQQRPPASPLLHVADSNHNPCHHRSHKGRSEHIRAIHPDQRKAPPIAVGFDPDRTRGCRYVRQWNPVSAILPGRRATWRRARANAARRAAAPLGRPVTSSFIRSSRRPRRRRHPPWHGMKATRTHTSIAFLPLDHHHIEHQVSGRQSSAAPASASLSLRYPLYSRRGVWGVAVGKCGP